MPAISFCEDFAIPIKNGIKRTTIRRPRKRPIKVGDIMHLYTGMRTKKCKKIGVVTCISAKPIIIMQSNTLIGTAVYIDGEQVRGFGERLCLAHKEGFETYGQFIEFFTKFYGLPFEGTILEWDRFL